MQEAIFDTIIIGSGPSGLTASIYSARALLKTLVIGGNPSGGQLTSTSEVENFPGFPEGIQGPDLINKMRDQSKKFDCEFVDENVTEIMGSFSEGFTVKTDSSVYKGRTIIVATGASARWIGLESEQKFKGKGVSACGTCDGFFYKGKVVAVVGAGDAAMEDATYLTKFASKVYVIVRGEKDKMKASKIMQERAVSNPKIEFIFNTQVKEVLGDKFVTGLKTITTAGVEKDIIVDGLFVAIGHEPNTGFLKNFIELDEKGYVKLYNGTTSSKEGVFVSGDVADRKYRQAITASAFGCMAAMDVSKFLSEN